MKKKEKNDDYGDVPVSTGQSLAKQYNARPKELALVEIKNIFDRYKNQLAQLLPHHTAPDQMIAIAMMACQKEPKLRQCTWQSLSGAVLRCAQSGLIPDGEHAAIVPYWNSKLHTYEAQFQAMYTGILKQAYQEEKIESVHAHEVRENDDFEVEFGVSPTIRHKPRARDRGDLLGAYGVVHLKGAEHPIVEWLDLDDMARIEKSAKSDAWKNHRSRMFKKSALNAVLKYVPKSKELTMSIALSEMAEAGQPQHLAADIDNTYVVTEDETPNETRPDTSEPQNASESPEGKAQPEPSAEPGPDSSVERRLTDEEKKEMGPPGATLTPEEQAELEAAKERLDKKAKAKGDSTSTQIGDLIK